MRDSTPPERVALTGADCFLRAFDSEVRRTARASHLSQLVLRLGPGFDTGAFAKLLSEVGQAQPILRAPIRRRFGVLPPEFRLDLADRAPLPPLIVHEASGTAGVEAELAPIFAQQLNAEFWSRAGHLLRCHVVRHDGGRAGTDLALTWVHMLFDGAGSERFVRWLDEELRIDQIVLQIADSSVLGTSDTPLLKVITGTPTASAQSSNPGGANYRAGAAALPNTALRLADITVPAGATSIINSNVTSRRPWARGMYLSSVGSGGDITISQTSFTGTGIGIPSGVSCECSGNPIRFAIQGVYSSGGTETFSVAPFVDGAVVTGLQRDYLVVPSFYNPLAIQWMLYPSAGAHIFAFQVKVSGGSVILAANGTTGVQSWLEELVRPNAG
jgi:hypothetical protein